MSDLNTWPDRNIENRLAERGADHAKQNTKEFLL